ncbi:MAG: hypothetical protein QOD63_758, partial [Actinomycetota bacterium]|nr:hypothetical protein [Actinomycetota bacterium]
MQTVTFYSYKGGTGRTLLLANLAWLAASLGRKVVALDFDLEAPGLLYKLFRDEPRPRADGLVGWLRDTHRGRDRPASLDDYIVKVPLAGPSLHPGGSLTLMPAGRAPSPNYFQDLRHLRLEQGLEDGWVLDALVDLRDQLANDLETDLLLIDARTGITPTNRVTTHVLADEVVALALDTPEQLEGTRSVLRSLQPLTSLRTNAPIDLHLVLSRVLPRPRAEGIYALTTSEREQVARVRAFLTEPAQPIASTVEIDRVHLLHTDPALNQSEFLALEGPGPRTKSALHVDYWRIATAVLGTDVEDAAVRVLEGARDDPERLEELAHYFVAPDVVAEARGAKAGVVSEPRSPHEVGLEERVELLRRQAEADPTVLPDLATQLLEVAARLRDLGRRDDATGPTEDSVGIYRRLAEANPGAWEPDLATSLNKLSIRLAEAGRRTEGLVAIEEAVSIFRRLAEADPAAWEPGLAMSLNNLSVGLAEAGRRAEGLVAVEASVAIRRRLAEADPGAWEPDMARSLNHLSNRLAEAGRRDEGLAAIEEAVGIRRRLAEADPAAWEPDLARSLNNLSNRLAEAGRRDEGLVAVEEAVGIYRRLAEANPAAWEP